MAEMQVLGSFRPPSFAMALNAIFDTQGLTFLDEASRKGLRLTSKGVKEVVDAAVAKLHCMRRPAWDALPTSWREHVQELVLSDARDEEGKFRSLINLEWPQLQKLTLRRFDLRNITQLAGSFPKLTTLDLKISYFYLNPACVGLKRILKSLRAADWPKKLRSISLDWEWHEWEWDGNIVEPESQCRIQTRRRAAQASNAVPIDARKEKLDLSYFADIVGEFPALEELSFIKCVEEHMVMALAKLPLKNLVKLSLSGFESDKYYYVEGRKMETSYTRNPAAGERITAAGCWPRLHSLDIEALDLFLLVEYLGPLLGSLQELHASRIPYSEADNGGIRDLLDETQNLRKLSGSITSAPVIVSNFFDGVSLPCLETINLHLSTHVHVFEGLGYHCLIDSFFIDLFTADAPRLTTVRIKVELKVTHYNQVPTAKWRPPPHPVLRNGTALLPSLKSLIIEGKAPMPRNWVNFLSRNFGSRPGCRLDLDKLDGLALRPLTEKETKILEKIYHCPPTLYLELFKLKDEKLYNDIFIYDRVSDDDVVGAFVAEELDRVVQRIQRSNRDVQNLISIVKDFQVKSVGSMRSFGAAMAEESLTQVQAVSDLNKLL